MTAYSCDSIPSSSWIRTGGTTTPSSAAIWRRIMLTRRSSEAPGPPSTSGTSPKPTASSSASIPTSLIGSAGGGGSALAAPASSRSPGMPSRTAQAIAPKTPAISRNGSFGSPGTSAKQPIAPAATSGALRWRRICPAMSLPRSRSDAARVTMIPVATEMSSAGICAASPSPTVSSEYCWVASPKPR